MALDSRELFIRLHAGMPEHPKVDPLSDAAFRVLIEAWCLCRRTRNDGRIPLGTWQKKWKPRARKELVEAGLVVLEKDAAVMHDWLEHQPSVAELDQKRNARVEAGRKGGVRSGESRRGGTKQGTKPEANASAHASPELEPELKQNTSENEPEVEVEEEKEIFGYVGGESLVANTRENDPPDPFCPRHPGGTSEPCGQCAERRKAWVAANLARDKRTAAEAAARAERQRLAKQQAAEDRASAVANCPLGCAELDGYIDDGQGGRALCDHRPPNPNRPSLREQFEAHKRGQSPTADTEDHANA